MKEDFLQYIWANSLYRNNFFTTCNGKKVRVLYPGELNRDAGPDFFNARLQIDDMIFAGNVEIHLKSSDWYRHGHHTDPSYNTVILSVVKTDDVRVYDSNGREVECVVLEYAGSLYDEYMYMRDSRQHPGCMQGLENIDDSWFYLTLQSLAIERLERKVEDIRGLLKLTGNDWEECFYRLLCKYWSGNVNSAAFYQLALYLPYKVLLKYADRLQVVEALVFGVSGLLQQAPEDDYVKELRREYAYYRAKHQLVEMPATTWKFMRIHPDAFPTVRLALLSAFICRFGAAVPRLIDARSLREVEEVFEVQASTYWTNHYAFGKLSVTREKRMGTNVQHTVLINTIVPFLFIYGKEQGNEKLAEKALSWLEQAEPESNYIVNAWKKCGFTFDSALQTQALIQLRKEYCDKHLCLRCRIGREVLKSSSHTD